MRMATKVPRYGKFTKFMPYHIFREKNRNMASAIMNCNGMTHHLRKNGGWAGPGFDNRFLARPIQYVNLSHKVYVYERPLLG